MIERDESKQVAACDVCKKPFDRTCAGDPEKIKNCRAVMGFASMAVLYFAELNVTV
jgi:hypothetical protein